MLRDKVLQISDNGGGSVGTVVAIDQDRPRPRQRSDLGRIAAKPITEEPESAQIQQNLGPK